MSENQKLLILGGKPIGSCEIVNAAKKMGIYTIVTDYLSVDKSPAKKIADEYWQVSTNNLDLLEKKCKESAISGVTAAVHEFNIEMAIKLNERLGFNNICSSDTWIKYTDKREFKNLCKKNGLPVANVYELNDKHAIKFPVITKPADGSGSRGFSICNNLTELEIGYNKALEHSSSKNVLIEEYIPYDSVIIHYTILNGEIFFSGMSDKVSMQLNKGGSVMALQVFPSKVLNAYLTLYNDNMKRLIKDAGFKNGVLWIEAFNKKDEFIFNEIGYRFGGSLTYYPVKYFTGFNQLEMMINFAMGKSICNFNIAKLKTNKYAILPLHVQPGLIKKIKGIDKVEAINNVYAYVPVHFTGDYIQNWASAQQVLCYIHIIFDKYCDLIETVNEILSTLHVLDDNNKELLFCLYDINSLEEKDYE